MGKSIVTLTVEKLKNSGFRAAEACPGKKLPALTGIAVAVDLQRVDLLEKTAELEISVLAPASMGAQACQKAALSVGQVLQADGADCTQSGCTFDGLANLFCTRIVARYAGTATADDWAKRAGFSVWLGDQQLGSIVSLTVHKERGANDPDWVFELEEFFRPESVEEVDAEEPFRMTMYRPMQTEIFTNCRWTYQHRVTEQTGTRQIRRGTAEERGIQRYV